MFTMNKILKLFRETFWGCFLHGKSRNKIVVLCIGVSHNPAIDQKNNSNDPKLLICSSKKTTVEGKCISIKCCCCS